METAGIPPKNLDARDRFNAGGKHAVNADLAAPTYQLVRPGAFNGPNGPTEESLAREWAAIYRSRWCFDYGVSRWYRWDASRWVRDDANFIHHLIGEHLRSAAATIGKVSIPRRATALGVEFFVRANHDLVVAHDVWDADHFLLGTPGGTIDLRTGKLSSPEPGNYITRQTAVAPAAGVPARWIRFIGEVTNGDEEFARYLQAVLGYALTGSTREHQFFFAEGGGGNGKSVFLNTATRIMDDYATTAAMDTFTASKNDRHTTDVARLDGARLVSASETTEGRAWDESRIKQLTGGDRMTARFMRQDNFEFTPRFKLIIVGNHAPVLHNVDEAMRRRFNVLPFRFKPPNPDRDLEEKLAAEHPQILQWMIDGCLQWQREGLVRPQVVTDATDGYLAGQDLLGQWLEDRCERKPGKLVAKNKAFEDWRSYAREAGEDAGTQNAFTRKLEKRGIAPWRNAGVRYFRGVDLKSL